jgi:hypothetical protein
MRIEKQGSGGGSGYGYGECSSPGKATKESPRPRSTALRRWLITLLGLLCSIPMGHYFWAVLPMENCALDAVYLAFVAFGFGFIWSFIEDK